MEKKILVVDDEEAVRYVLKEVLGNEGFTVICAESAEEAFTVLKNEVIHVFIIDLHLPGISGIELCSEIRIGRPVDVKCAITGHGTVFSIVQCREVGFDDYIVKPFDNQMLINFANRAFEKLERWDSYCHDWSINAE